MVNVALPRIRHDLGFSGPGLAWAVNGYVLMAGGALGLACLVTLAIRHTAGQMHHGVPLAVAVTRGDVVSFRIGAALPAAELTPDTRSTP